MLSGAAVWGWPQKTPMLYTTHSAHCTYLPLWPDLSIFVQKKRIVISFWINDSLIQMELNRYQNTISFTNFQPINDFYLQFESHFKWKKRHDNFWTTFRNSSHSDTEWRSKERFSKFETGPRPVPKKTGVENDINHTVKTKEKS